MRLIYNDSTYVRSDELLVKDKLVSIHQRNLQFLLTEIFKVKNGVSTGLTETFFGLLINLTVYEITVYCLEEEIGLFFTK